MTEPGRLAHAMFPCIMEAARAIMQVYRSGPAVEHKADGSPVTAADTLAEDIILQGLGKIAPNIPVIAEEEASAGRVSETASTFFLVDPLDGTKEFAARRPEFTINVALIENRKPVFGLIYAPALCQLFWTESKDTAFEADVAPDDDIRGLPLSTRRPMQTRDMNGHGLTIVASRSHGSAELETWLGAVDTRQRTNIGSSLKFCLVARGAADLYPRFGPTREWDTAAGHALLVAAGGAVTNIDGSDFLYGKKEQAYLNPGFIAWSRPGMISAYRSGALAPKV